MRFPPVLLIILIATFLFRLPSLFEPYWYGDEGIFAAVAHQMLHGDLLYRDTWDNKPPFIYLIYALSFAVFGVNLFWVKLLATIAVLGTQMLLFLLVRRLFSHIHALVATALFGMLVSLPSIEGNLALTEIFMLPAMVGAVFLVTARPDQLFLAGILSSIPFLLKPVSGLEFAAIFFFVFFIKKYPWNQRGLLCVGFLLLPMVSLLFFLAVGAFQDYIFAAFLFFSGYLAWTPTQTQTPFDLLFKLGLFLLLAAILIGWTRRSPEKKRDVLTLLLLFFAAGWTSAMFAGRPYPHYTIEAIPATVLLVTLLPTLLRSSRWIGRVLLLSTMLVFGFRTATVFPTINPIAIGPYYANFWKFLAKEQAQAAYHDWFDPTVNRNDMIVAWLDENLSDERSAYIWGDAPWIYSRANVANPVRYIVAFHVLEIPHARAETITTLEAALPQFIIILNSTIDFLQIEQLLIDHYDPFESVAGATVWQRLPEKPVTIERDAHPRPVH